MLPWLKDHVDELIREFGEDPWPYGIEPNRPTLEALVDYLFEQDMISRRIPVDDLFVMH
jgi:4,5-dihydroxyphthalate decarboxylase